MILPWCRGVTVLGAVLVLACSESPETKGTRTGFLRLCPGGAEELSPRAVGDPVEPNCTQDEAVLCESFEESLPEHFAVERSVGGPNLALQQCQAADGEWAAAFASDQDDSWGFLRIPIEPMTPGPVFVRTRVLVPEEVTLPGKAMVFGLREESVRTDNVVILRILEDGSLAYSLTDYGDSDASEPGIFEKGRWVCLEASFELGAPGAAQLKVDGEVVIDMMDVETQASTFVAATVFGGLAEPEGVFEMAVDDFVVARAPIGCD